MALSIYGANRIREERKKKAAEQARLEELKKDSTPPFTDTPDAPVAKAPPAVKAGEEAIQKMRQGRKKKEG